MPTARCTPASTARSVSRPTITTWPRPSRSTSASTADSPARPAYVYSHIAEFQLRSKYRHLQRIWNYLDDINTGAGDDERYRVFCSGRSTGLTALGLERFPAATAIGRRDGSHRLQVYWLAGREPGFALENPRQMSAYHTRASTAHAAAFSRAMLVAPDLLMISGTASIVGHRVAARRQREAADDGDLQQPRQRAGARAAHAPALPGKFGRNTLIKAYLRDPAISRSWRRAARETAAGHAVPGAARRRVPRRPAARVRLPARGGVAGLLAPGDWPRAAPAAWRATPCPPRRAESFHQHQWPRQEHGVQSVDSWAAIPSRRRRG
jgi:hypothetical protein